MKMTERAFLAIKIYNILIFLFTVDELDDVRHALRNFIMGKYMQYFDLKADMNSDILLQTAAIFSSNELLSETGYWLGVCHGWFHLHGLPPAARSGSEIYKIKNSSCPQRDSNSRPLDFEAMKHEYFVNLFCKNMTLIIMLEI